MNPTDTLPDKDQTQARIRHIQSRYREWAALMPKLEAARRDWQRGEAVIRELWQFYFDGEYTRYYNAIENGLDVDLTTQGEYSVMSQDALWDAFKDQERLAWQQLRAAIAVLDRNSEEEESGEAV